MYIKCLNCYLLGICNLYAHLKNTHPTNIYCISTTKKLCLRQVCLSVLMAEFKNPLIMLGKLVTTFHTLNLIFQLICIMKKKGILEELRRRGKLEKRRGLFLMFR